MNEVVLDESTSTNAAQKTENEKKKKRVCRFYARTGRCRFENNCRFVHDGSSADGGSVKEHVEDDKQQNIVENHDLSTPQQTSTEETETACKTQPIPKDGDIKIKKKVCRFYKSRGGCARGSTCKFYHGTRNTTTQDNNTTKPLTPTTQPTVHTDALAENTAEQNSPPRREQKKVVSTTEKLFLLSDQELCNLRSRELDQLVRRFGKNKARLVQDDGPWTTYHITFTPSDPDWPFDIESLLVRVTFPKEYPIQIFSASLCENQTLPLMLIRCVNQEITKYLDDQQKTRSKKDTVDLPFRPFLRWLDRNLEELFILAAKQMKRSEEHSTRKDNINKECPKSTAINNQQERAPQGSCSDSEGLTGASDAENIDPCNRKSRLIQGQQRRQPKPNVHSAPDRKDLLLSDFLVVKNKPPKIKEATNTKAHYHGDGSLNPKNDHIVFIDKESEELAPDGDHAGGDDDECTDAVESFSWGDVMADDKVQLPSEYSNEDPNVKPKGTEIRLRNLELFENTSTLRTDSVALTVECDKCKSKFDTKADNTRTTVVRCERCTSLTKLGFRPCIVHQYSTCSLGYLDLQGCHPFDLVMADMSLVAGCLACSSETIIKGPQYGSSQAWCNKCHQKLKFQIESTRFYEITPTPVLSDKNDSHVPMPKKKPRVTGLREGFPLPDKGACKHYKKSYRWLRFPCCGKCYPCDVCHDEQETHEMKYATRMVCGFCSKEQSYSQNACIACGSSTTRAKTTHWEGGKGCRNKTLMSRSDDKKFKNKKKTTSRKSQAKTAVENKPK